MEPNERPDLAPAEPALPQAPETPPQPPAAPLYVPPWAVPPQPGMPPQPGISPVPPVPTGTYAPPTGTYAPPPSTAWTLPQLSVQAGPAPGVLYAGFGVRFVAYVIDWVILGFISGIIWFAAVAAGISVVGADRLTSISTATDQITPDQAAAALTMAQYLYGGLGLAWLVTALYFIVMWPSGGTVGMRALGLRVAREEDGRPISFGRATARYLGYLVDWLALGIGLLWVGVDARKQGWHDKIAGTLVVRRA